MKWKPILSLCFLFLHAADPPRIISHPQELNVAVPGKPATFTIRATGSEPLTYQWQWKPSGEGSRRREWQSCDVKRFPGATSSILTIPSVQKSNEGIYRCTVSNHVGTQSTKPAILSVGKILPPIYAQHAQYKTSYYRPWVDRQLCTVRLMAAMKNGCPQSTRLQAMHWCMHI